LFLSTLLPLFPLDLVLLPGTPLPLHIFEPRYREMISECLDRSQHFGVLRGKEQELAEIGCTAHQIAAVTGHASLSEVQRYTKAADRKRMAREAMAKLIEGGW